MTWAIPKHSRETVNLAGKTLVDGPFDDNLDFALDVINNWRSSHSFPLNTFQGTLRKRAREIDKRVIVAQRLKRLSSIEAKLRRFRPNMKLSQMQDLGGCRAVLRSVRAVDDLVQAYKDGTAKNPTKRHEFLHEDDYIRQPKADGYRSYHLVYRYRSRSQKHSVYNGLKIELQLRSQLQHAWATAVETVSIFTEQALKFGGGVIEWRRFFALMGSAIAMREKTALVPGSPTSHAELVEELREIIVTNDIERRLRSWNEAVKVASPTNTTDAFLFLLYVDPRTKSVTATGFGLDEIDRAVEEYLAIEKTLEATGGAQVVLVSADSVGALRTAYPNYYLDTTAFIDVMRTVIA